MAARPRSTRQTSPGLGLGILSLQGVEHHEVLVRPPVAIRKRLRIGFDVKQAAGNFAPLAVDEGRDDESLLPYAVARVRRGARVGLLGDGEGHVAAQARVLSP